MSKQARAVDRLAEAFQDVLSEAVAPLGDQMRAIRSDVNALTEKVDLTGRELKKLKETTDDGFREVNEKIADLLPSNKPKHKKGTTRPQPAVPLAASP